MGVGVGVISYICHSTDVRAEWPFFQRCQLYDWPLFFNKKYMHDPIFQDSYVKGPIFLTSWYFRSEILRGCVFSWYSMNCLIFV